MDAPTAIDLSGRAIYLTLKIGGPIMLVALVVGLVIGLLQALTSIQEMTLTFVPKIIAILLCTYLFADFMAINLADFLRETLTVAVNLSLA